MFLGILVGFEQQIDQSGDDTSIPQGTLVLWTQGQVSNQANHSLLGAADKEIPLKIGFNELDNPTDCRYNIPPLP